MYKLELKLLVLESLKQALSEISPASRQADLAAIDAQIKALQLQISDNQKKLVELNKKKIEKSKTVPTTKPVVESKDELFLEEEDDIIKKITNDSEANIENLSQAEILDKIKTLQYGIRKSIIIHGTEKFCKNRKARVEKLKSYLQKEQIEENFPKLKNKLSGGKGDKLAIKDVDPKELRAGIKVEMEHTNDPSIALEISLDHLSENPKYYTDLKVLEDKEKKNIGENIMKLKNFYFDEEKLLNETGEMSKDSIKPDGEFYEWAKNIKLNVLNLQKLTKGKVKFIEMRPFDKYQGPYAYVKINDKYDSIWNIETDNFFYIEKLNYAGSILLLSKAINGDNTSIRDAKNNVKQFQNESIINESEEKVPEIKHDFPEIDIVNYFELKKGIRILTCEHPDWDLDKIKEEAVKNLQKDPVFYSNYCDDETRKKISHGKEETSFMEEEKVEDQMVEFEDKNIEEQQVEKIEDMGTDKFKEGKIKKEKVTQLKEEIKKLVIKILNEENLSMKDVKDYINPLSFMNENINETIGHTYDSIADSIYKKYKKSPNWSRLAKIALKNEWQVNKNESARIMDMLHGEDYFDDEELEFENIIKEDRLNPEEADYEINKKGIVAYLKKKKAENFTKLIKSLEEIELLQQQIDIKKKEIAEQSKEQDEKYEEKDEQLRQMVLGLFNAEELANTLYVDAAGSLLTLAKKTEKNEPSQITPLSVDYKKAWEAVTQLFTETNIGLVDQMKEVLNQFTVIGETYTKPGAKRKLRRGVKEESILKEVLNEFKFSDIWTNVKSFLNKFKSWGKVFKKKIDLTNQIINQL